MVALYLALVTTVDIQFGLSDFFRCGQSIQRIALPDFNFQDDRPPQEQELHLLQIEKVPGATWLEFAEVIRTHSRYGLYSERIQRRLVNLPSSERDVFKIPAAIGKVGIWRLVQPHLRLVETEYRRRNWPVSFREMLAINWLRYLNEATHFTVFDSETNEALGGARVIQIPYRVRGGDLESSKIEPAEIEPKGILVQRLYGQDFSRFRNPEDDIMSSVLVPPPDLIPVEEYLGIRVPLYSTAIANDDGTNDLVGFKSEIGALAVRHKLDVRKRLLVLARLWVETHGFFQSNRDPRLNFFGQSAFAYGDQLGLGLHRNFGLRQMGATEYVRDDIHWVPEIFSPAMMDAQNFQFTHGRSPRFSSTVVTDLRMDIFRSDFERSRLEPLPRLFELYLEGGYVHKLAVLGAIFSRLELRASGQRVAEMRRGTLAGADAAELVGRLESEANEIEPFALSLVGGTADDRALLAQYLTYQARTARDSGTFSKEKILKEMIFPIIIAGDSNSLYWPAVALHVGFEFDEILKYLKPKETQDLTRLAGDIESRLLSRGYSPEDLDEYRKCFSALLRSSHSDEYIDAYFKIEMIQTIRKMAKQNLDNLMDLTLWTAIKEM